MKEALLIINMGGPDSVNQVQPYLREIFRDPAILPLPNGLRQMLAGWIAARRAEKVAARYRLIGGKSPLRKWTEAQVKGISQLLRQRGGDLEVAYAFRYSAPFIGEAIAELARKGVRRVIVLPLFPHYTFAMTGSVMEEAARACKEQQLEWMEIEAFGNHPAVLEVWGRYLTRSLDLAGEEARVLFVAHGVPLRNIQKGDPYADQVARSAEALARTLPEGVEWSLCYQSKVGPVAWTGPYLEEELPRLTKTQAPIVLMPLSFVSDCLETLYDLDILAIDEARAAGVEKVVRARVFNDDPRFAEAVCKLLQEVRDGCEV